MPEGNDAELSQSPAAVAALAATTPVEPLPVLSTPDITRAQLVGAVPVVAKLLAAFGIYTLTADQTEALTLAVGGGAALFVADAVIRVGRSLNQQKG